MKITIFWLAWSGTSTIWKLLSEKLEYEFMSSWNIMRQWASDLWYSLYDFESEYIKNDDSFDKNLDTKVREYWLNNDDFIFESRLAWYFIPDSFKIYLKCDESIRYNRIQKREAIPLVEVIEKNQKREKQLVTRYAKIYPQIEFPPNDTIFDLLIDVDSITPEEVIDLIMKNIWAYYMTF